MTTKNIVLTIFTTLFLSLNAVIAQNVIEKNYFDTKKEFGGEIVLNKSIIKVEGSRTYKIFEIESPDNGNYYLNFWMTSGELENFGSGKFSEYELTVNNDKQTEKIKPEKISWHNASFIDHKSKEKKTVSLKKGLNQIAFSCDAPEIPDIEFIRLSKDKSASEISDARYVKFVNEIEDEMEMRAKNPKPETDTLLTLKSGIILPNPAGNYDHHIGVTFRYTTYKTYSFTSGQQVSFTSFASSRYEHVLEVFSSANPEAYSWVCKSSSGTASINITIPSTDTYYIRVRAYRQESAGLVDLNINGQYYFTSCPVSGSGFMQGGGSTTYNYFTCYLSGDSHIWIEDDSAIPGKIRAYNDNYNPTDPHTFSWGLASRVKKSFSMSINSTLISSASSNNPIGNCNLYIGCQNSTIMSTFPYLYADDAIQSAPQSSVYNCISWSGGIINYWEWPLDQLSQYYIAGNPLGSFDAFYLARGYTRTGATSANSIVDLWYNPNYYGTGLGSYTHASVTNPAYGYPHGYDWESKPGSLMRTFHPRYSLFNMSSFGYGNVSDYYTVSLPLKSAKLLDEEIAEGTAVIENVELTDEEKAIIDNSIKFLTDLKKETVEQKYQAWKSTWSKPEVMKHSDPRMYAQSQEYKDLIKYCNEQGRIVWPILFNKFDQGDFFAINAIEDLTLATNKDALDKVKNENKLKSASQSGAVIYHSLPGNIMKYIKELLKGDFSSTQTGVDGISYSNSLIFKVSPNPAHASSKIYFDLPQDAKVSVSVIDLNGKYLSNPVSEQLLMSGCHSFDLQVPKNFKGVCFVRLIVNNNLNIQKVIVQ